MNTPSENLYYIKRKKSLLRDFDTYTGAILPVLAAHYGTSAAEDIIHQARREYEPLIYCIPYIGGNRNFLTRNLLGTTRSLAVFKTLRKHEEDIATIGALYLEMMDAFLSSSSSRKFLMMKIFLSTKAGKYFFKTALKRAAAESQKGTYADDFIFEYVEGRPGEFDCGINYTQCAIVNFFRSQGAGEFAPYLCLYDYPKSRTTGTGLVRTMTLAEGAEKCDFRFRFGREPENRQKTKIPDRPPG
jgi:hypothetical protein